MQEHNQMEEKSPTFSHKEGIQKLGPKRKSTITTTTANQISKNKIGEEEGEDLMIECSGKYCGSCTAGMIADCIAICCCPCALVNLFALAFVKAPWIVARKCIGKFKKRRRISNNKSNKNSAQLVIMEKFDGSLRKDGIFVDGFGEGFNSASFEAEKVWLQLYEDGHLGFGSISFTGIQS